MASTKLIQLYQDMADLTREKCTDCRFYCCAPEYCEATALYAAEKGVELERTRHRTLPFLGIDGKCTVAPHLRPICTVHTCEKFYMTDLDYSEAYFKLREEICELEFFENGEEYD